MFDRLAPKESQLKKKLASQMERWHKPKLLRGSELKIAFVKYDCFEACTSGYGFLNPLINLVATVSSGQAWQVQRQSVLDGLGLIG